MKARAIILAATVLLSGFALPATACRPFGSYEFAEDKDGGIWFTEGDNNTISRLAPDGTVTAHKLPTPHSEPSSVTLAPDGSVWFAEMEGKKVGRLDRDGRIVEFAVSDGQPFRVAVDAGGEAWFTVMADHSDDGGHAHHADQSGIGRVDRDGRVRFHSAPEGWPTSIAFDARGRTWVTLLVPGADKDNAAGRLALLSRRGKWSILAAWDGSCPSNLIADKKGGIHFSDGCRKTVSHRTSDGRLAVRKLPPDMQIQQMSLASDGKLWFTDRRHVGHIDGKGKVSFIDRADNGDATMAILATRNGDVVFSEFYNYNINRLTAGGAIRRASGERR